MYMCGSMHNLAISYEILGRYADVVIAVPSRDTARIQESHIMIGHILCDYVERSLFVRAPS